MLPASPRDCFDTTTSYTVPGRIALADDLTVALGNIRSRGERVRFTGEDPFFLRV